MLFNLLLCYLLFIPIVYSNNVTLTKSPLTNKTQNAQPFESLVGKVQDATKVLVSTEGGSVLPKTPVLSLPKDNPTDLMTLENEMNKNKKSPVKARKGALLDDINIESEAKSLQVNNSSSIKTKAPENLPSKQVNTTTNKPTATYINSTKVNSLQSTVNVGNITIPHKPTVTSYDELSKVAVKSSAETTVSQLPSPNGDTKVYAANANSHPGMVMPIVITILVVPMFAVLGYMALKRGQEAWKNRHYKRMDFLLDGMYND